MKHLFRILPILFSARHGNHHCLRNHCELYMASGEDSDAPGLIEYKVCLSPGCISDGAKETLERLQALAPPNVIVQEGGCISACGNGPVVVQSDHLIESGDDAKGRTKVHTKEHRRVKGEKLANLLAPRKDDEDHDGSDDSVTRAFAETPENIIKGYEIVMEADECFKKNNFKEAARLYEEAISVSFVATMELQRLREQLQPKGSYSTQTQAPIGLEWLIRARRNEAQSLLEIGEIEDAMLAAQSACNLSKNTSADSFQVLAEIYRSKDDLAGELQALRTMLALPVDEESLSVQVKNKRRSLGFRLTSLERQLASE